LYSKVIFIAFGGYFDTVMDLEISNEWCTHYT